MSWQSRIRKQVIRALDRHPVNKRDLSGMSINPVRKFGTTFIDFRKGSDVKKFILVKLSRRRVYLGCRIRDNK